MQPEATSVAPRPRSPARLVMVMRSIALCRGATPVPAVPTEPAGDVEATMPRYRHAPRCRRRPRVGSMNVGAGAMAQIMHQGEVMMRFALVLMALVLLGVATEAPAACRLFGTQLECDLGGSQLLIGTQAAPAPAYARSLRPQLLQGGDPDDRSPSRWPLRLEFQNVGVDPSLCRRIGNETYCY